MSTYSSFILFFIRVVDDDDDVEASWSSSPSSMPPVVRNRLQLQLLLLPTIPHRDCSPFAAFAANAILLLINNNSATPFTPPQHVFVFVLLCKKSEENRSPKRQSSGSEV